MTTNEALEKFKLHNIWKTSASYEHEVFIAEQAWQAATTEANKRIADLESEVAELHTLCQEYSVKNTELQSKNENYEGEVAMYKKIAESQVETSVKLGSINAEIQASINHLREALLAASKYVDHLDPASIICEIISKALSTTPAESLQAHDNELLEYKVDAERYRFMKRHDMTDVYSDLISYRLNPFEFNPIDLDSVIDEALKEVK
jgi:predicted RNase H-like nuclease (RuvC/YqgF family)